MLKCLTKVTNKFLEQHLDIVKMDASIIFLQKKAYTMKIFQALFLSAEYPVFVIGLVTQQQCDLQLWNLL